MVFYPNRLVFQECPEFEGFSCAREEQDWGEIIHERGSGALREVVQDVANMQPVYNGELDESSELIIDGVELVEHVPGVYFYKGKIGETHEEIMQKLMGLASSGHSEARDFIHLQEFYRLGVNPFNNVPDPLPSDMMLPVPVSPQERQVSDIDFINEYARAAMHDMQSHEYYGLYMTEFMNMMTEDDLLAMMVAVARAESGEHPIGRDFFHRYEPEYDCFSYSCFHVLMEGAGLRARRNLDMSEGQTYDHYNACKLFLAFLMEKALLQYEGEICAQPFLEDDEEEAVPAAPSDNFEFVSLGVGGNLSSAIEKADASNAIINYPPFVAKLEAYVKHIKRSTGKLQPEDGVGVGYDDEGAYVVFYNSKAEQDSPKYSPKLRVDYNPVMVLGHLEDVLPSDGTWDHTAFGRLYCGPRATSDYRARLDRHFDRAYSGLDSGEGELYEQVVQPFYLTFAVEELGCCYEGIGFHRPSRNSGADRDYQYAVENAYADNVSTRHPLRTGPQVDKFKKALKTHIESNYPAWPVILTTDQIGLMENNGTWRLVFCRDRHCETVLMEGDNGDPLDTPPPQDVMPTISPTPIDPAPESSEWSELDTTEAKQTYLREKFALQKVREVVPDDTLGEIIRDANKLGIGFDELPAKEPYEDQINVFLSSTGGGLKPQDYIGYGVDNRGPYFICCRKNGHCSVKLYGPN